MGVVFKHSCKHVRKHVGVLECKECWFPYAGTQDENFDPGLGVPHSIDSPLSMTEEGTLHSGPPGSFGLGSEGGGVPGEGERKAGLDELLLSKEAVKIDGSLDQIFEDSEEEEEGPSVSLGLNL